MADTTLLESCGIYTIRNLVSGRVYVGSATGFGKRWSLHRRQLKRGTHHSKLLQQSWNKHGEACFAFDAIEIIDRALFPDKLALRDKFKEREQFWMDSLYATCPERGFNIAKFAFSVLGLKRSDETKAKQRANMTPERNAAMLAAARLVVMSSEKRAAINAKLRGIVRSEAQKAQQSATMKGRKATDEARANQSAAQRGRTATPETCAKKRRSQLAYWATMTDDRRQELGSKLTVALTGKKHTAQARANMARAQIGRKASEETLVKLRRVKRAHWDNMTQTRRKEIAEKISVANKRYRTGLNTVKSQLSLDL